MEESNLIPIIVSIASMFVSIYVGYRITRVNEASLRRSSRMDHTKLLFELDRSFIDYPMLWTIYDSNPLSRIREKQYEDPLEKTRREAMIYAHFNLFDIVFINYQKIAEKKGSFAGALARIKMTLFYEYKVDAMLWETWKNYIKQLFEESSEARNIFNEKRTQELYPPEFVAFINSDIIKKNRKKI